MNGTNKCFKISTHNFFLSLFILLVKIECRRVRARANARSSLCVSFKNSFNLYQFLIKIDCCYVVFVCLCHFATDSFHNNSIFLFVVFSILRTCYTNNIESIQSILFWIPSDFRQCMNDCNNLMSSWGHSGTHKNSSWSLNRKEFVAGHTNVSCSGLFSSCLNWYASEF